MKRFLTVLLAVLLAAAVLCVPASADRYEPVAQAMSELGLLKGTGDGLELDKTPNRAQAAALLVRLFGAEQEAQADYAAGKLTSPFKDVLWDAPYVAWLYAKGLAKGISETEFGSALPCRAHDYVVFMLRTLGYRDGVDFDYADAVRFAEEKGFYLSALMPGEFRRGDLAAVTYQTLAAETKSGGKTLLEELAESGAVDKETAQPLLDRFDLYAGLNAKTKSLSEAMDADLKLTMTVDVTGLDETVTMPLTLDGSIKTVSDDDLLKAGAAMLFKAAAMGDELDLNLWMKDGWCYIDVTVPGDEGPEELKLKMDLSSMRELLEEYDMKAMKTGTGTFLLSFFTDITAKEENGETVYRCVISGDAISGLVREIIDSLDMEDEMTMDVGDVEAVYTLSGDQLRSVTEKMTMTVVTVIEDEEGNAEEISAAVVMDLALTVNATGPAVRIEYPDFSDYIDLDDIIESMSAFDEPDW